MRPSELVSSWCSPWYGPAMMAVMYDAMRGVVSNVHVAVPLSAPPFLFVPPSTSTGAPTCG